MNKHEYIEVVILIPISYSGGTQKPEDGFLDNLKEPGRMTGNIKTAANSPMLNVNTLFICFPSNP